MRHHSSASSVLASLALSAAVLLSGCGSDDSPATGSAANNPATSPATEPAGSSATSPADPADPADEPATSAAGGAGTAVVTYQGTTYTFDHGGCSPTLDVNLFTFRDPATPGIESTFFAVTVVGLDTPSTTGGTYQGAINYQLDGVTVFSAAGDATLVIAPDLSGGTFTGTDFFSHDPIEGSYTC